MANSLSLLGLFVLSLLLFSPVETREVLHVVEYARHGARSNMRKIENMDLVGKYGKGVLTGNGMRQHFNLGKMIRQKYSKLFEGLKRSEFEAISTGYARTQMSAQSQLAGMFSPPSGDKVSGKSDLWLPPFEGAADTFPSESTQSLPEGYLFTPVQTVDTNRDYLFAVDLENICPGGHAKRLKIVNELEAKEQPVLDPLGDELERMGFSNQKFGTGNKWNIINLFTFADDMQCYKAEFGQNYPAMTEEVRMKLFTLLGLRIAIISEAGAAKLLTDKIARSIIDGMDAVIEGKSSAKKFRLLLGHDSGIIPLSVGMGLSSSNCIRNILQGKPNQETCLNYPDFASQLLFELAREDTGELTVTLFSDNKPIPFCTPSATSCPYSEFKSKFLSMLTLEEAEFVSLCDSPLVTNKYNWKHRVSEVPFYKSMLFWVVFIGTISIGTMLMVILFKTDRYSSSKHDPVDTTLRVDTSD